MKPNTNKAPLIHMNNSFKEVEEDEKQSFGVE
jgi:hypothetical protein